MSVPTADPEIERQAERITALERAFRQFKRKVPGLSTEVVGHVAGSRTLVHPVAGFQVRLQSPNGDAGVSLYVSWHYGELTTWRSGDGGAPGAVRERFRADLDEHFGWNESVYPTADELANDLLAYMQYNYDRLTGG